VINGAHTVIYSRDAEADRAFFRDVLDFPHVDVGGGWLIFALPPAEVAVHPTDEQSSHQLFLMCDDLEATMRELTGRGVQFAGPVSAAGWGSMTSIVLPGGGEVGLYQPRHQRPPGS
jgi:catechol 2,3-dioxygenase-like lactoylglutathione lyase family enzyme